MLAVVSLFALTQFALAEDTFIYAVQISAAVQTAPPKITLNWEYDPHIATNYTIYRKTKGGTSWSNGLSLPGTTSSFADTNVSVGSAYEYQIVKLAQPGYTGYGYIYAGIEAPLTESRGKLILIVANTYAASLSTELARLESDLNGDGWTVVRHDVSSSDSPANVRNLIISDYNADPANVNSVFLFGHVPVYRSGNLNYDTHLARPMPADALYGDVVGTWNTNLNYLPADVQLMVGRVDFDNMPGIGAPVPGPSEVELLRNYLNKDHNWRHRITQVPRRALMGNRRGDELGQATAASGYRNFEPFVGPGNIVEANISDISAPEVRWGPMLGAGSYLWAYGCGGGFPNGVSHLGTNGEYNDLYSKDIVGQDAKAVFTMVFGSWFGEWDVTDDFMRSFLATPSVGLTCCMAGRPHWFVHHMGLGETIGYSTRLTMNNSTLYQNQSNLFTRAIYIALMGDPTLRMDIVAPPGNLSAASGPSGFNLNWSPSGETVLGYHVYRRSTPTGGFNRLNGSLLTGTSFTDTSGLPGYTYMVRAVKLQTTPSGTYFNASQGIFANVAQPMLVTARLVTNGLALTWNSQPGTVYRVLGGTNLVNWTDISGNISATGSSASWTDTTIVSRSRRFYRITTP